MIWAMVCLYEMNETLALILNNTVKDLTLSNLPWARYKQDTNEQDNKMPM